MANRFMIVKLIYLSILLTGCHSSVADENGQAQVESATVDYELIEVENIGVDPKARQFFRYPEGTELENQKFEVVEGKGLPVCEAYTEYLSVQKYPKCGPGPRCYRWYLKEYAGIKRPAFKILNEEEERALVNFLTYRSKDQQIKSGSDYDVFHSTIWKVKEVIDIDRDGHDDVLYMLTKNRCDERMYDKSISFFKVHPYLWDTIKHEADPELINLLAGYRKELPLWSYEDHVYSIFSYEGKTYFDSSKTYNNFAPSHSLSSEEHSYRRLIQVYEVVDGSRKTICKIRTKKYDAFIEHKQCG